MTIKISTSIDISVAEADILRKSFPQEHFQVENNIFRPGADSTVLVVNFVIGALVGGVIYDAFKGGMISLYQRLKKSTPREVVLTIKVGDDYFKIRASKISKLEDSGDFTDLDSFDDLLHELDEKREE